MGTEITNNLVNRAYADPYRTPYSKDPPAAEAPKAKPDEGRFSDVAARADIHAYDGARATHHEEMMRVMDPQAYREFQQIKKTTGASGSQLEPMRFMMSWIENKAVKDPAMERKYDQQKSALDDLKSRFKNTSFKIEGVDDGDEADDSEFTVTLTKEELHTLTYGTKEEKEALYKQIDDAMKSITDAEEAFGEELPDADFGIDTKADAASRFFAVLNGETYRAGSAEDLFKLLFGGGDDDKAEEA